MPNPKRKLARSCLVCGASAKGIRLGVDACRACSSFFQRATIQGKSYVCRQSNHKCLIRKDEPFMCRRCRYEKCVAVGMRLSKESQEGGMNKNMIKQQSNEWHSNEPGPSSSPQSTSYTPMEETLMEKMRSAYRICGERRRQSENFLRSTAVYKSHEVRTNSGEIVYLSTHDFCSDSLPSTVTESLRMAKEVFPQFDALSPMEQQAMLKVFAASYHLMEMNYLTEKYFPGNHRFMMTSHTTCFDIEQMDLFFSVHDESPSVNKRMMEMYTKKTIDATRPVTREANLTETEFGAAMCIVVWNVGHASWMPAHIVNTGDEIITTVIEQLGRYYRDVLKCEEYASRLGRLMSLIYTIQEVAVLMQEEHRLYKFLGIFNDDDLIAKILL